MKAAQQNFYAILSLGILAFASCTAKDCSTKQAPRINQEATSDQAKIEPNNITNFNNLDFNGLSETQAASIIKLFNDEVCPCGCPKTFAQCLDLNGGCKPGELLAKWAISQYKLGTPERLVLQALSEEINLGFSGEEKQIKLGDAYRKGNKNAPITIVEFADFECPACKFAAKQFKEFLAENSDKVQAYFMHFPLSTHPNAERAAIAAEAAGLQGKFWQMHDLLFAYNGALSAETINELASQIFNMKEMTKFEQDLKSEALADKVKAQKKFAMEKLDILGTPSFFMNGRPYHLSFAKDAFDVRLQMEMARSNISCNADS